MSRKNSRMPVLFIGHGAPDILLQQDPVLQEWRRQGQSMPRPERILVVTSHWETADFTVSGNRRRETIHDFSGFPPALYEYRYPAPADDAWARELAGTMGIAFEAERGLDHAAWVPLTVLYPEQDIPVTQISVAPSLGFEAHQTLGERLARYRDEGVLILASGVIVHNLSRLQWRDPQARPEGWAQAFMDSVAQAISDRDAARLADPGQFPGAAESLPTAEHYLPLLVAQAAADGGVARPFASVWRYGNLSQHSYRWD